MLSLIPLFCLLINRQPAARALLTQNRRKTKMTNFVETSNSRNAKRTYDKIADAETFASVVASFAADTTMGLTRKEAGAETYKTRIDYFDAVGEDKGYLNFYAADKTAYTDMASLLTGTEAAETAAGVGGSASADAAEDTWSAKYSCSLGEDTFTVTITREYMLVNGFEKDETIAAVESWADSVEALSTPQ